MLANLAGLLFGIYYYAPQLAQGQAWQWPFMMDSPLAVALFGLALGLCLLGKGRNWLNHLAGIACLKVGVWTLFVIVYFSDWFLAPERAAWYSLLALLHLGMVLEGLWALGATRASLQLSALMLGWFLGNDLLDYWLGLHPILPAQPQELAIVGLVTAGLSLFTVAWFHLASRDKPNLFWWLPVIGGELRGRTFGAGTR